MIEKGHFTYVIEVGQYFLEVEALQSIPHLQRNLKRFDLIVKRYFIYHKS